jgi:hypothetical protein
VPGHEVISLRLPAADGLGEALADFGRSLAADARVVVVTGSSPDRFGPPRPLDGVDPVGSSDNPLGWLRRRDLITVGALRGEVSGPGLQLALACDLRVAADEAVISLALDAGATPQALGDVTAQLAELVGYPRALEFIVARREVSGRAAAQLGLVNLAGPAAQHDAAVDELVEALLATPRAAATEVKALLAAWRRDGHAGVAEVVSALVVARGEA